MQVTGALAAGALFFIFQTTSLITLNYIWPHWNSKLNKGGQCDPNGPAIKFRFWCWADQGRANKNCPVDNFSEGASLQGKPWESRYNLTNVLARSRYKLAKWPLLNPGAECGLKALAQRSRYKVTTKPLLSHGAEYYWRVDARIRVQLAW